MTDYEKTKIRDMINGMLPEEREIVAEEMAKYNEEVVTNEEAQQDKSV